MTDEIQIEVVVASGQPVVQVLASGRGVDGHTPVIGFGQGSDVDRLTVDGVVTGPHLSGGGGDDLHFTFAQDLASTSWSVVHNLGKFPSVTIIDSSGNVVFGDVNHTSDNALTISFATAFSGTAYLN